MCEAVVTCHRPSGQETDDTSISRRLHFYDTDTIMGITSFLACLPAYHQATAPGLICNIILLSNRNNMGRVGGYNLLYLTSKQHQSLKFPCICSSSKEFYSLFQWKLQT